jgi:hypothetical protein
MHVMKNYLCLIYDGNNSFIFIVRTCTQYLHGQIIFFIIASFVFLSDDELIVLSIPIHVFFSNESLNSTIVTCNLVDITVRCCGRVNQNFKRKLNIVPIIICIRFT